MARPQQPELARSAKTDLDPQHVETGLQGQKQPGAGGETGPVPPDNQPGHHPAEEQDKPDPDAFAAKLGTKAPAAKAQKLDNATKAVKRPVAKSTPAKTAPPKAVSATKRPVAKPAPPAASPASPAAAPAPPATAPSKEEAVGVAVPQPPEPEPRLVALAMLPLRATVSWLEQLDKVFTERLTARTRSMTGGSRPGRR